MIIIKTLVIQNLKTSKGNIPDNSKAKLKQALYDSYVEAFRWATDRIGKAGVVGFAS